MCSELLNGKEKKLMNMNNLVFTFSYVKTNFIKLINSWLALGILVRYAEYAEFVCCVLKRERIFEHG